MRYERDNIRRLHAYVPGEQPQRQRTVKLNTNENPYPPPGAVLEAIRRVDADRLRRYPPPRADGFREIAGRVHGVAPEQIIATNGGDELLRLAITVFCEPGGTSGGLGVAEPSYSLYPILAAIHDAPMTGVPLGEDFELPEDFADRLNEAGCRLAMVVSPHAPSGRLEPIDRLRALADRFSGVVLIDEAYVDFAAADAMALVREGRENVLLLRSMSKGYSLAGLRFGYGIGHADLIAALDKARDSYNVDVLAQAGAAAALEHRVEAQTTWQHVVEQRGHIADELTRRGWRVLPSQANFLFAAPPAEGPSAREIHEMLKQQAIFVRYFDQERVDDKLRITVGTPEENRTLLEALP